MKIIKFINPCKYKIIYYKDNEHEPIHLIVDFKENEQIAINMILEDHENYIDITYNQGAIALFGLKKSDFVYV